MTNSCQIPTPIEYARTMLDYAGYRKGLYRKRISENSCGEGNILCEIVSRYIEDAVNLGYSNIAIVQGLENDIEGIDIDNNKVIICIDNSTLQNFCVFNNKKHTIYPICCIV